MNNVPFKKVFQKNHMPVCSFSVKNNLATPLKNPPPPTAVFSDGLFKSSGA